MRTFIGRRSNPRSAGAGQAGGPDVRPGQEERPGLVAVRDVREVLGVDLGVRLDPVLERGLLAEPLLFEVEDRPVVEEHDRAVRDQGQEKVEGRPRRRLDHAVDHDDVGRGDAQPRSRRFGERILEPAGHELDLLERHLEPGQVLLGQPDVRVELALLPVAALFLLDALREALERIEADDPDVARPHRLSRVIHAREGRPDVDPEFEVDRMCVGRVLAQVAKRRGERVRQDVFGHEGQALHVAEPHLELAHLQPDPWRQMVREPACDPVQAERVEQPDQPTQEPAEESGNHPWRLAEDARPARPCVDRAHRGPATFRERDRMLSTSWHGPMTER